MPERSDLDRRLRAVERALTDGDHDVATLGDAAAITDRLDALEARIDDLEERNTELEAATQAVRGYVGNVRAVNNEVEDRADAALAAVERIEARLDETAGAAPRSKSRSTPEPAPATAHTNESDGAGRNGDGAHLAGDGYGIEMPPPGSGASSTAATNGDGTTDEETTERSVIERVREAL